MGISHHGKNKHRVYVCWPDAVKDQMLARGYISDNWHFSDPEFQQIVAGMRRLKPVCNELATPAAANNVASMPEIEDITLAGIACIIMREVYATIGESIYPNPSFLSRDFPEASGRLLRNHKEFTSQDMAN